MKEWILEYLFPIFIFVLLSILGALLFYERNESNRLVKQCMADGHKEYECSIFTTRNWNYTPIFIPIGH